MHPILVASRIDEIKLSWYKFLQDISGVKEKESAYRGLCVMVQTNRVIVSKV
jgi:transportin-1